MAYEEAAYQSVYQGEGFEVRFYEERLVIQTRYIGANSGFQKLFKYISGGNQNSQKIEMTTPVTMVQDDEQMIMQFYLPSRFDINSAPLPADSSVQIESIKPGHFAIIQYSGFASDKNFSKHAAILKAALDKNDIKILGQPIKATYNGPFTLPHLRRNEAMYPIRWNN